MVLSSPVGSGCEARISMRSLLARLDGERVRGQEHEREAEEGEWDNGQLHIEQAPNTTLGFQGSDVGWAKDTT